MPKAYWIARVDVQDPEAYKNYVEGAKGAFARHGTRFLVRGGAFEPLEGNARARNVAIEFESMDKARACFNDPEYQAAREHRLPVSEIDLVLVEGHE